MQSLHCAFQKQHAKLCDSTSTKILHCIALGEQFYNRTLIQVFRTPLDHHRETLVALQHLRNKGAILNAELNESKRKILHFLNTYSHRAEREQDRREGDIEVPSCLLRIKCDKHSILYELSAHKTL